MNRGGDVFRRKDVFCHRQKLQEEQITARGSPNSLLHFRVQGLTRRMTVNQIHCFSFAVKRPPAVCPFVSPICVQHNVETSCQKGLRLQWKQARHLPDHQVTEALLHYAAQQPCEATETQRGRLTSREERVSLKLEGNLFRPI